MARDIDVDINARDRTARAVRSASSNIEQLGKKINGSLGTAAKTIGKATSMVAAFASTLGPASVAVGLLVKSLVNVTPALAVLPSLAAAVGLLAATAKIAGPAIVVAFKPVAELFGPNGKLSQRIGALASKGLPQLARSFIRVNMPTIAKGMERIASAENKVVLGVGRWVNSARGQATIRDLVSATARASERLSGHVTKLAVAFGNMVGRVGSGAISKMGEWLGRAADAAGRLLGNTTKAKVDAALGALAGYGGKLKSTFTAILDVGSWMGANTEKVRAFSDALALVGITVGALTGNWAAVIVGSFTLLLNHWETVKGTFAGAPGWFSGVWKRISTDPSLIRIWEATKANWTAAWTSLKATVSQFQPVFAQLVTNLKQMWADWGPVIATWAETLKPVFVGLGIELGVFIGAVAAMSTAVAYWLHVLHGAFVSLADRVGAVMTSMLTTVGAFAGVMARIPGPMQGAFRAAAKAAEDAKVRINTALAGIHSKTVSVDIVVHGAGDLQKLGIPYVGGKNGKDAGFSAPSSWQGVGRIGRIRRPRLSTPRRRSCWMVV